MSDPKDKQPDPPGQKRPEPTAVGEQGTDKRSGRVAYDARGNPIWEWQLETGVYSRDVSTHRLKKLDLGDLSIAETGVLKKPTGLDEAAGSGGQPMPGGGFNPYDNSPVRTATAPQTAVRPTSPAKPRSPADLRKLEEWMKLKKQVEQKKQLEDDED